MSNSFVQLPPDSSGKKLLTEQHTVGGEVVQVQVTHLVDPHNPDNKQHVDIRGQAYTRFAEGSPTIDPFGNLRVGEGVFMAGYEFTNGDMADLFTDTTVGAGAVTHVPVRSETVLSVGANATDSAVRLTNRYHYYQPGVGQGITMTLGHSDAGKTNNRRRWGYADQEDGLFFELDGTTMYVVQRSSTSGVVVEQRVAQSAWNGDKLDGTGPSGLVLDLTKANYWTIDFAWLGVGPTRFGVLAADGSRWTVHTFHNPGTNVGAYMRSGSLPLLFENVNTGVTSGTSEMKLICAAVYSQSRTDYTFWRYADIGRATPVTVATNTPIFSLRVKTGARVGVYPESINVLVQGGAVKLTIVDDATLTDPTWTLIGSGVAEGDIGATAASGGEPFYSKWVGEGVHHMELGNYYETNDEGYHRLADDSGSYTLTLVATKLTGSTVTVAADINYRELR